MFASTSKLRDMVLGSCLGPNTLPNTTTGRVENVGWAQSLLAYRDHIALRIHWIMDKYKS